MNIMMIIVGVLCIAFILVVAYAISKLITIDSSDTFERSDDGLIDYTGADL